MKLYWLDHEGIGADLKMIRMAEGLSLQKISADTGIALSHIWNVEKGAKEMSLEKFFVLCSRLAIPASQLVADNLVIDQFGFEDLARKEMESDPVWGRDEPLRFLLANYIGGASKVVCYLLLTPGTEMTPAVFDFPTQMIEDAIRTVAMRVRIDEGIRFRESLICDLQKRPAQAMTSLGLFTAAIAEDFARFVGGQIKAKVRPAGWRPQVEKVLPRLISAVPMLSRYDPALLGKALRELGVTELDDMLIRAGKSVEEASGERKALTNSSVKRNLRGVKSPFKVLLERLSSLTKGRGAKARLADFLKVPRSRVSEWLHGNSEPGGEITLRLLEWSDAEEAKQTNAPGSVTSTAKGKARSTPSRYEEIKNKPPEK